MKGKHYAILGIIAYVVFLIGSLPSSFVWGKVVAIGNMSHLERSLVDLEGSIWKGKARLQLDNVSYPVDWSFSFRSIWRLRLGVSFSSHQELLDINGRLFVSPFGAGLLDLRGNVSPGLLNQYLEAQSARMQNPVFINAQEVNWSEGVFTEASGRVAWEGGLVTYLIGRNTEEVNMPPISGQLSSEEGQLLLRFYGDFVNEASELVVAKLHGGGLGSLQVRHRLLDLVGQKWSASSQPDDVIFEVSQQLWN